MKILHINHSDRVGGAAIAVMRIADSLNSNGNSNTILVRLKTVESEGVITINYGPFSRIINSIRVRIGRFFMLVFGHDMEITNSMNMLPSRVINKVNLIDPDVVHIHWVGHETISFRNIEKINKPVVWTLHDMWAMSGVEHYPISNDYIMGDFTTAIDQWTWNRKRKLIQGKNIFFVAPSLWMFDKARESSLLSRSPLAIIPNPLDLDFWVDRNSQDAKVKINLPIKKKVILFGVYGDVNINYKGFDLLVDALSKIKIDKNNLVISIFGGDFKEKAINGIAVHSHGFIKSELMMRDIYNSADVFIMPSRLEAFGQTASESMACGTPVVAFSGTGPSDFIYHKKTGWLANPFDTEDLARGIDYVLSLNLKGVLSLSKESRKSIEDLCSYGKVAQQYKEVYERAISLD
ncbi:MAG: glycosyltransferase [Bacteroidetes bacterium]|nr:glycosyltransferase [Bacteroidota bacterium]